MSSELEKMYEDVFCNRNCTPCALIEGLNPGGKFFSISPRVGKGYCWVYHCNEHVAITIMDQVYYEDCLCEIVQPDFLCIGYYYSVSGEILTPYRRLSSSMIHAHIGVRGTYRFIHHKNIPVRSISITLMPEYYEKYLRDKYPGEYENPKDAFACIDGIDEFPELLFVLNQIKNYMGRGMSARLYYEGKVEELLSLVIQKAKEQRLEKSRQRFVYREDIDALISVASYLDDHFAFDVRLDFLARIACMSPAKLKYTFKSIYHCSVQQYIQNKRIGQAEHLLLYTDLAVSQIAKTVGYRKPGSFSELFKKHTGVTPVEYRQFGRSNL
ncbi:MAG TPA: AraC family transcriptional regulator [Anaerovoracaceae bacterium]|nr:AraC family transcriptional regulator [Anaerovoracaceae bacterium]